VYGDNGITQRNRETENRFLRFSVSLCKPVPSAVSVTVASVLSVALLSQAPPTNVLLITIDTVRADHIGAYGYAKAATPVLDRLAREGVRFSDATTQAPLTGPAHAALLTGLYPARIGRCPRA
jgi:predicted AlkP superfamily pyrophosphatase or phosphodiesterase